MNELKQWSIWAARIGLLFSFFLYIGDSYVEEEFYPAAVVTFLIFWATFVPIPEEYHSEIKSYGSSVLWNGAALALLFFVFYASSTAAVLINEEALPGLFSLLRNSGISLAWIIVIPGLLLTPFIPRAYPLFEFVTERTRERAPSTSSVRSMRFACSARKERYTKWESIDWGYIDWGYIDWGYIDGENIDRKYIDWELT